MTRAVHQLTAGFKHGDAIGNEALVLQQLFRSWGYTSEIFSDHYCVAKECRSSVSKIQQLERTIQPDDVALLHLSTGSPVNQAFASLPCRKAILYHNITPPDFFHGVQERAFRSQAEGLEQVRQLAQTAQVNMAVSRFNATELEAMGFRDVKVMPLFLDFDQLRGPANQSVKTSGLDDFTTILFVGRCVRNKKLEDCMAAFAHYQAYINPRSRFVHVGSHGISDPYYASLIVMAKQLKLKDFLFTGPISQDELNAWFYVADVFLSMSEHEGFCIPLIESMVHDLPVMAYAAAAIPETMDGAGILFHEKDYAQVGEMVHRVATDQPFRNAVINGQRERLARYEAQDLEQQLRNHLEPLLSE
jgi:glycosyltransferase involved in cell wall biosynthesis